MKRFHWPLQRLLDITVQRERVLQAELLTLARRIAMAHQEIFRRQGELRSTLEELTREEFQVRLPKLQTFWECSVVEQAQLNALRDGLEQLQQQRSETITEFRKKRSLREGLDRLRAEAIQRFRTERDRQERKQLDECFQLSFTRELMQKSRIDQSEEGV